MLQLPGSIQTDRQNEMSNPSVHRAIEEFTAVANPMATHDYMVAGFELVGEPLNLRAEGQPWYARIVDQDGVSHGSMGLVLGSTPWMGILLRRSHNHVIMADVSKAMLLKAAISMGTRTQDQEIDFVEANWLNLPQFNGTISTVLADNSLSFLSFPDEWAQLLDDLADRMDPQGRMFARYLCMPSTHRKKTVDNIIDGFVMRDTVNYTEVRTALLYAHWNEKTYGLETENALRAFEVHRSKFDRLFTKSPITAENDLLTITKYRDSGAVFYAPPLTAILDVVAVRFKVIGVHFGPYCMSEYFPLIVASRR